MLKRITDDEFLKWCTETETTGFVADLRDVAQLDADQKVLDTVQEESEARNELVGRLAAKIDRDILAHIDCCRPN